MSKTIRELQAAAADTTAKLLDLVPAEKRDYAHALIFDHLTYHAEIGEILRSEHLKRGTVDSGARVCFEREARAAGEAHPRKRV